MPRHPDNSIRAVDDNRHPVAFEPGNLAIGEEVLQFLRTVETHGTESIARTPVSYGQSCAQICTHHGGRPAPGGRLRPDRRGTDRGERFRGYRAEPRSKRHMDLTRNRPVSYTH